MIKAGTEVYDECGRPLGALLSDEIIPERPNCATIYDPTKPNNIRHIPVVGWTLKKQEPTNRIETLPFWML